MKIMSFNALSRIFRNKCLLNVAKSSCRSTNVAHFHGSPSALKNCCEYYTRLARARDHEAVMCVMSDVYLKCEPAIVNLGLSGQNIPAIDRALLQGMKEGMTIVAVRCEDETVVGAAINTGSCPWHPDRLLRYANSCECGPVQELLKFYAFIGAKPQLWQKFCVLKIFECSFVAVLKECQGQGLAKRLIRDSWYLARDCGYRLFRIDCTSRYTAKVAENFGWECVYSIPYERYINNVEQVFKQVQEPHTTVSVFADQVRFCKDYCAPYPACKKRTKKPPP